MLIGLIYESGSTSVFALSTLNLKLQVEFFDLETMTGLFVTENTDLKPIPLLPILIPI